MDEQYYEKLFNIKTSGEQKIFNESIHYNRYEPTSYSALEILSKQYKFTSEDNIVDFGCGKGRFSFYINHYFNSSVTGIEMNNFFYKEAIENKKNYSQKNTNKKDHINFLNCFAERYDINSSDNKFYFFNPFSMQIFAKVIKNILVSTEKYERTVDVILYYPSNDYIYFLETSSPFLLINEIKVPYIYDSDPRHKFLIYRAECYRY
jgi:cyclopropane fatty-acyl-phospholipid synthase-like methyltransferase